VPIYEYTCQKCKAAEEKLQRMSDPPPVCPHDPEHGPMVKRVSASNFELRGGGWAKDGYGSS